LLSSERDSPALLIARTEQALRHTAKMKSLLEQASRSLSNGLGADHSLTREATDMLIALR
jgi:hypothetical protein